MTLTKPMITSLGSLFWFVFLLLFVWFFYCLESCNIYIAHLKKHATSLNSMDYSIFFTVISPWRGNVAYFIINSRKEVFL